MMRNSREFPKWLNKPETKEALKNKRVMMYCTGGIRCERATALLSQMERAEETLETKGIFHVRGGIDRYLKTFPEGGYWKGRNYLFDLRGEQCAEEKDERVVERETKSVCCVCKEPYALYKGKHACGDKECKVPVIVCDRCRGRADGELKGALRCPLCEAGVTLRDLPLPDLVAQKRKLALDGNRERTARSGGSADDFTKTKAAARARGGAVGARRAAATGGDGGRRAPGARRGGAGRRAPATVSARAGGDAVEWIADKNTGFFYGVELRRVPLAGGRRGVRRAVRRRRRRGSARNRLESTSRPRAPGTRPGRVTRGQTAGADRTPGT